MTPVHPIGAAPSYARAVVALLAFAIFDLLLAPAFYYSMTQHYPGANDFYVPWRAAQARLLEGRDPYGPDVTRDIQIGLFGHTVPSTEHQWSFAYPLYTIVLVAPFVGMPYDAAQAAWFALLLPLLVASGALALDAMSVRLRPLALAGFLFWLLAFYPATRSFILGQLSIVVVVCLAGAWWAAAKRHDWMAGALLALSTIKPQMIFLVVPLALLCAWQLRRRRVAQGFALVFTALLAVATFIQPDWPIGFVHVALNYAGYFDSQSPVQIAVQPPLLAMLISGGLLLAFGAYALHVMRRRWLTGWRAFGWALIVAHLVASHTATTNQLALVLPLMYDLAQRRPHQRLRIAVALGLFLVIPWWVFLATKEGNNEAAVAFLPVSFGVAAWWLMDAIWARVRRR